MAETKNETKNETKSTTNDDVIARLASKGEQALQRLADLPGGTRALQAFNDLRARVDDLTKKVRGIDELEQRVAKLEKELAGARSGAAEAGVPERADPQGRRVAPARQPRGTRSRSAPREHLEARRSRPGLLAVELDRDAARRVSTVTAAPRSSSAFGCGRWVPR